tara:strand:+ start:40119 stop:41855 length:1737 start_codon:yes stop_codon:yes gene_type:complete
MQSKHVINLNALIKLLKPHSRELLWGWLSMVVYVLCWPLLAWLAGLLIPAIGQGDLKLVIKVITQALFVFLIQKLAQFSQDVQLAKPALRISQDIRKSIFNTLQNIELTSIKKLSTGDITYRLTEDADRVGEVLYKTIQDTTPSLMQLVAVLLYMLFLDWKLSLSTLIIAPFITVIISIFGQKVMSTAEKSQRKVSSLASLLGEVIQGLPLIRAFAVEDWMQKRFDDQVEEHRIAKYKTLKLLALQHPVVGFIEALGILIVLGIGASRIQGGYINGQEFSSFFAALLMLIDPISHLTTNFNEFKQGQASLKRLQELELEPLEETIKDGNKIITKLKGNISFKDINFSYRPNKKVIFNLNLEVKTGEVIALVGPSGAGKSTIFSLLLGFIKPQLGAIYLDDIELETIDKYSLRRQIGIVPQSMTMLSGTIKEAIKFGRNVSDEDVISASKLANSHDFITKMSNGYDTYLQERGNNLSGGQIQRISIARALISNPSLLLLDEATSALDAEAEKEVQLALRQSMKNRSVLIIAHRLSTVQEADRIVFIENGHIQESGSHNELIRKSGRYSELCQKQFIKGQ